MKKKFNTLSNFADRKNKKHFDSYRKKLLSRTMSPRQSVERAHFTFDYQGIDFLDDFEFTRPKIRDRECIGFVNIPICNDYVKPRIGFIDWLNFTFAHGCEKPHHAVGAVSRTLEMILGYGVTSQRSRGLNFYKESYILGNNWGFVCVGGQNDTLMVSINGEGCAAARKGWEKRLYKWATTELYRFQITRVDVAHDLFNGEYTVDNAVRDFDSGLFGIGGRIPKIQQYGNWRIPDDVDGRTVYLGARWSGKFCRIYEKGKQLGKEDSPWVRIECEWRNKNRIIPSDILIEPGRYLAGAYPALFWLSKVQSKIKTKVNKEKIVYEKAIEIGKRQLGGLILLMSKIEKSAEDIVSKLIGEKIPKRFISPDWRDLDKPICVT
jgi:phage replication initiation protein